MTVERDYRVLLTTDKPIYQPGQVIHLRALALGTFDLTPAAGQALEVTIADGKGNKVFRKTLTTSDFGVGRGRFPAGQRGQHRRLQDHRHAGQHLLREDRHRRALRPAQVRRRAADRTHLLPARRARQRHAAGRLLLRQAGGGRRGADRRLHLRRAAQSASSPWKAQTDEQGSFAFEFDLPAYIAGSDLEGGLGRFYLQASRHRPGPAQRDRQPVPAGLGQRAGHRSHPRGRAVPPRRGEHPLRADQLPGWRARPRPA